MILAARVCFIPKRSGGQRPLGVVNLVRWIIARAATRVASPQVLHFLVSRGQFGVGVPAGTEVAGRLCAAGGRRGRCGCPRGPPHRLQPHGTERSTRYSGSGCPPLLPLARALLRPVWVTGRGFAPFRWSGIFMGCSLSPLFFALAEEALLEPARARLRELGVRTAGFLDDKALAGPVEGLAEAFALVEHYSATGGQVTNSG